MLNAASQASALQPSCNLGRVPRGPEKGRLVRELRRAFERAQGPAVPAPAPPCDAKATSESGFKSEH
jgi:hypothetical protein